MHRVVNNTPEGKHTDHNNGNGLDNRRHNLKTCTVRGNAQNLHISKTSKYPGVSFDKSKNKWAVSIYFNTKNVKIGDFTNEKEAADAYRKAESRLLAGSYPKKHRVYTSKCKGVSWQTNKRKWQVSRQIKGVRKWLGSFDNEEEAFQTYQNYKG